MIKGMSKGLGAVIVGLSFLIAVMLIGTYGFGWFERSTADFRGGTQAKNLTVGNGAYRIAAYDQFFDRCASVQTKEATIAALEAERADSPAPSPERLAVIQADLTALTASRADAINRYNADAAKTATVAQFHASNLPASLDLNGVTTCTATPAS